MVKTELETKEEKLRSIFRELGSVVVAFSSGVDSAFLLKIAAEELGENAVAVTVTANFFPKREYNEAKEFCQKYGIKQVFCHIDENDIEGFSDNPPNRCYICKKKLLGEIIRIANEQGAKFICEGSNVDDEGDYRPGLVAIKELGIRSPLKEAGLRKAEIRELSKKYGLETWDKPSFACLASRFVYGEKITSEKLKMVELAEQYLMNMGFKQLRVRVHGNVARIEVLENDISKILQDDNRVKIYTELKNIGFDYVALDLMGYRTGSMNEVLEE